MLDKLNEPCVDPSTTNRGTTLPPLVAPISIVKEQNGETKKVLAYFDSSAKDGCVKRVGQDAHAQWDFPRHMQKQMCGGVGNDRCEETEECFAVELKLEPDSTYNKLKKMMAITTLVSSVHTEYEMIIGLPVFRRYGLFQVLSPLLEGGTEETDRNVASQIKATVPSKSKAPSEKRTDQPPCSLAVAASAPAEQEVVLTHDATTAAQPLAGGEKGWVANQRLATRNPDMGKDYMRVDGGELLRRSALLLDGTEEDLTCEKTPIFDDEKWEKHRLHRLLEKGGDPITTPATIEKGVKDAKESTPGWLTPAEVAQLGPELPIRIYGTPSERRQLMAVCIKHKIAFGTKLRLEPARIEPLTFTVDKDKWFTEKGNQQPPRLQSQVKDKAIWDQVHELEDLKVVVPKGEVASVVSKETQRRIQDVCRLQRVERSYTKLRGRNPTHSRYVAEAGEAKADPV